MNIGSTTSPTPSDLGGQQALSGKDWRAVVRDLGPAFIARADAHDADDSFVLENYRELKEYGLFSAGVPTELGGGGATHRELCALLRELVRLCGSTALALSMHTHLVATTVWRYRQGHVVGPLLQRICAEQLVLVSTGASDWLDSSGVCHRVDRGYQVSARSSGPRQLARDGHARYGLKRCSP